MSSTRVITGVDDRGRPKSEWRPLPEPTGTAYGFMEPAYDATTIQRRQATPEELEASRAREAEPSHLAVSKPATPPRVSTISQESRLRGGAVTAEIYRKPDAPRPASSYRPKPASPEEEPAVSMTTDSAIELSTFDRLALAAAEASRTHQAKEAADTAWDVAREALARAYAEVEAIVEPLPPPDDDHVHHILTIPLAPAIGGGPVPEPKPAPRSRTGEGQRPGQASARDRRSALVMDAMARLGDDQGAVAAELGMKKNAVAMVVKFARQRQAQA